jgi:hypothetical protein
MGNYVLFADGSYMSNVLSQSQTFFINPIEWNRSGTYIVTQFLPVALSNITHPSLRIISAAYGFSCVVPACVLLILALIRLESKEVGQFFQVVIPLMFGTALLICVSTSLFGAAFLFWIFVNLFTRPELILKSNFGLFGLFASISLFGDSYFLFAPAFCYLLWTRRSSLRKIQIYFSYFGLLVGLSVNILDFKERSSGVSVGRASNEALSIGLLAKNLHLDLTILAIILFCVLIRMNHKMQDKRILRVRKRLS